VTLDAKVSGKINEKVAGQSGDASFELDNRCQWGFAREDKYQDRGWCGSEYSIARFKMAESPTLTAVACVRSTTAAHGPRQSRRTRQ